jgi:uncharacterized protein YciW
MLVNAPRIRTIVRRTFTNYIRLVNSLSAAQLTERYQLLAPFIPQNEPNATETLAQCETAHGRQLRMASQRLAQTIERNFTAEMMNVMHPDICGEPSQNARQILM